MTDQAFNQHQGPVRDTGLVPPSWAGSGFRAAPPRPRTRVTQRGAQCWDLHAPVLTAPASRRLLAVTQSEHGHDSIRALQAGTHPTGTHRALDRMALRQLGTQQGGVPPRAATLGRVGAFRAPRRAASVAVRAAPRPEYIPNRIDDPNYVRIFDTTLRDGEQSPGATLTSKEKLDIARQLAKLGVDIIEAGFPIASPDDFEAVRAIAMDVGNAVQPDGYVPVICGLSRTKVPDLERAWDAVRHAKRPRVHTFIATSEIHMKYKLRMTPDQVRSAVRGAVRCRCGAVRCGGRAARTCWGLCVLWAGRCCRAVTAWGVEKARESSGGESGAAAGALNGNLGAAAGHSVAAPWVGGGALVVHPGGCWGLPPWTGCCRSGAGRAARGQSSTAHHSTLGRAVAAKEPENERECMPAVRTQMRDVAACARTLQLAKCL